MRNFPLRLFLQRSGVKALPLGASDEPFIQEFHEAYPLPNDPEAEDVRAIVVDEMDSVWAKTRAGVYRLGRGETSWAKADTGRDFDLEAKRHRVAEFTPAPRIPFTGIQCVGMDPSGWIWVGTPSGLCRYDGKTWSVRHSRRWLLHDDVRDLAMDSEGTVWVATAGGVSAIKRRRVTLADKADYFQGVLKARHIREPWLVGRCLLRTSGDLSTWEPEDDDNDGQYTAMALMMESCRYAASKDPEALEHSRKAFDALAFLQTVTETPGFVARSVVPASWSRMHDPNAIHTDEDWARIQAEDPRNKRVEVRWHPSQDGKWLWKGDTSSDEISGHFCGYLFYYELAADEAEKSRIRGHVRRVMDHIVDHGFNFVDLDGTPTRWGVWAPKWLNEDPLWREERYCNSLEILSFLAVTYHMTGDEKYHQAARSLLHDHHYLKNIENRPEHSPLTYSNIDNELLALSFPGLIWCEKDPQLLRVYRECLAHWYEGVRAEKSPYFNFTYGLLAGQDPCLSESVEYLRDAPWDLIDWRVDNSKRMDIDLRLTPAPHPLQTHPLPPPSERAVTRWDKTPWPADQGGRGESEWCPHYWLLPYWMGRHAGFISAPA